MEAGGSPEAAATVAEEAMEAAGASAEDAEAVADSVRDPAHGEGEWGVWGVEEGVVVVSEVLLVILSYPDFIFFLF